MLAPPCANHRALPLADARRMMTANTSAPGEDDMNRITVAATALAVAMLAGEASAQSKSLKDRLLGTWHFVIAEVIAPDGQKSFPFGPKPRGILIFAPEGDFAQIHIASEVPKIASGNRLEIGRAHV